MKRLWIYLREHRWLLALALGLAFVNQFFSLLDPQIFRLIVDRYATRFNEIPQGEFLRGVVILLLASVGVALVSRIAKNFQDYVVNVITQRMGAKMYATSVSHSFSLPFVVFEDQRSGELLRKLDKARTDAQNLIASAINVIFLSLVGILFVVVYAFIVHWMVGAVYFLMIPVLGGITYFTSKKIKKAQSKIVSESASLAGSTTETLRNVELVKSLGLEHQEINRLNDVNQRILELELKKIVLVRKMSFIQGTAINAFRSLLLLLMLWFISTATITIGQFFSLFVYSFFIFSPLAELGHVASQFQESRASMEQLDEILKIQPEPKPLDPKPIGALTSVSFEKVDFSYSSNVLPALKGVSVSMNSGQTIAFVGPSGSGKTTLVKLISGLYQPSRGKLLYNGIPHNQVEVQDLRQRIGLVAQETQLFAGTIRENLLFVNPVATDEACISALQAAAALSILQRADKGLETKIGEGGIKLSGGERQRLAIARALLRKPELLIFDEATSSLDSITERSITDTIQNVEKTNSNMIRILVAHRLSTIAHADSIYVLEKGVIVEKGSHKALLVKNGLYSALWRQQQAARES